MGKIRKHRSKPAAKESPGTFKNHENTIQNRLLRKSVLVVENATFAYSDKGTGANLAVLGWQFFSRTLCRKIPTFPEKKTP